MATATPTALKPSDIHVLEDFNPRTEMDKKGLDELAASIKQDGIIQPLIVAQADEKGKHQLIAGHRRFAAAKQLKLRELPVVVRSVNGDATALAVIENLQREDLNPIDEANGFAAVMEAEGIKSQKQLAERLGVSTSQVSDRLKLLKLDPVVQKLFADGTLPAVAGGLIEKAQRFNDRFAACLALVLAEDDDIDASRLGEYDQARTAFAKAAALAVNGPKAEDSVCECAVIMREGYINFESVKVKWPAEMKTVREDLKGYGWHVNWEKKDIDAARAYGCLFEHKAKAHGDTVTLAYAFDAPFVLDLLQKKWDKDQATKAKQSSAASRPGQTPEEKQAKAEAKRQEQERKEGIARHNAEFGTALESAKSRLQFDVDVVKAICAAAIHDDQDATAEMYFRLDPVNRQRIEKDVADGVDRWEVGEAYAQAVNEQLAACSTVEEALTFTTAVLLGGLGFRHEHAWQSGGDLDGMVMGNDASEAIVPITKTFKALAARYRLPGYSEDESATDPTEDNEDQESINDAQPAAE